MTSTPDPAPTLTDAELLRDVQAAIDDMATYSKALTAPSLIDALSYHGVRLALAAARPAGVTPNYDAALAKWNEWEDENADLMRWDGDVRYQAMCAAVDAARATADAAGEGGE